MKDKRHYLILIIILFLIILTGCSKNKIDSKQVDLRSYFSSEPGMVFKFKGEGNEFAAFTREIKFKDGSFIQFHDTSGTTVAKIYQVTKDQIKRSVIEKPGFYEDTNLLADLENNPEIKEIILQKPIEVGHGWQSGDRKREIVQVDETVTVPAGTFHDVIKVKVASTDGNNDFTNHEYYAKNVGLIMQESIGENYEVVSKLKSYQQKESSLTGEDKQSDKDKQAKDLQNYELPLLAYQLNHEVQSSFQAAYESYINLNRLANYNEQNFEQIISVMRSRLKEIAGRDEIEKYTNKLRKLYQAGAGEINFPTHEVVRKAKILNKTKKQVKINLRVKKYYPEREWSGQAYSKLVNYEIDLVQESGKWKIKEVIEVE